MGNMDDTSDLCIPDVPIARIDDETDSGSSVESVIASSSLGVTAGSTTAHENLSVSLEDLVENFDEKVNNVLKNLGENTNQMAPVQVRTQDEIMSESQVWWTLTGNYGNILPLDFNKTQIRRNQIQALSLDTPRSTDEGAICPETDGLDEEDLRHNMDMHQIISEGIHILNNEHPPLSADQVIEEIDEMMLTCDLIKSMNTDRTLESVDSMYSSMRSPFTSYQNESDLKLKHNEAMSFSFNELSTFPQSNLLTLSSEMEQLVLTHNADLVSELARRDELEYEKEVKNKFITLLVKVQDQRRKFFSEKKKKFGSKPIDPSQLPQYMTATVPFDDCQREVSVSMLEPLIKILEAVSENSPLVPNLLTEYILTVVCPSTTTSMIA